MTTWLDNNPDNPYPTRDKKQEILLLFIKFFHSLYRNEQPEVQPVDELTRRLLEAINRQVPTDSNQIDGRRQRMPYLFYQPDNLTEANGILTNGRYMKAPYSDLESLTAIITRFRENLARKAIDRGIQDPLPSILVLHLRRDEDIQVNQKLQALVDFAVFAKVKHIITNYPDHAMTRTDVIITRNREVAGDQPEFTSLDDRAYNSTPLETAATLLTVAMKIVRKSAEGTAAISGPSNQAGVSQPIRNNRGRGGRGRGRRRGRGHGRYQPY